MRHHLMDRSSPAMKEAFNLYLRTGTPVARTLKQARPTTHYIWRTRRDSRVRPSHLKMTAKCLPGTTRHPPATGRIMAAAASRALLRGYSGDLVAYSTRHPDNRSALESHDMIWHYYTGDGKAVTLSEIGHLREVAAHWAYRLRRLENWNGDIINKARSVIMTKLKLVFATMISAVWNTLRPCQSQR